MRGSLHCVVHDEAVTNFGRDDDFGGVADFVGAADFGGVAETDPEVGTWTPKCVEA
jgi:hypothetical protein